MRILGLLCLAIFFLSSSSKENQGETFRDNQTYSIEDENSFAVIMYDYDNSAILGFLDSKQNYPDKSETIETETPTI